jgi:hypothetical protein
MIAGQGGMDEERYPGEARGLRLFLEELLPVVQAVGEPLQLLERVIRRAVAGNRLHHLRHARHLFNHLPRAERQALSSAMLQPHAAALTQREDLLDAMSRREPAVTVCFELAREVDAKRPLRVELRHELGEPLPVRVSIQPGTLPSVAANALRRVAAMIEADRRLLSSRYWQGAREESDEHCESR